MAPSGAVPYGNLPFPGLNRGISARWSSARVFPTESRTFCPISSRPDPGLSQGRENFPSEEAHVASPFFFSIQPWDLVLQLSPMSQSSWQGSLGTRWVLTRPRRSRSFHPSSSRFPSEFRDIFPHLSPQKNTNSPLLAAQRKPGASDRSWECAAPASWNPTVLYRCAIPSGAVIPGSQAASHPCLLCLGFPAQTEHGLFWMDSFQLF